MWRDPYGLWWTPPQGLVDASAGFGDALSLGLTAWARNSLDIGSVDPCSKYYSGGQAAGILVGFIDGEGEAELAAMAARGELSLLKDITRARSELANFETNVTAAEFEANLIANGYNVVKQGEGGAATVLSNGESTYTLYTRTSTGEAGAQFFGPGGSSVKYSLGQP